MVSREKRTGRTPNGGTYSIINYLDEHEQPTDKTAAVKAIIVEYDAQGRVVGRTYGDIGNKD